jgi:hypothetical protein
MKGKRKEEGEGYSELLHRQGNRLKVGGEERQIRTKRFVFNSASANLCSHFQ